MNVLDPKWRITLSNGREWMCDGVHCKGGTTVVLRAPDALSAAALAKAEHTGYDIALEVCLWW